MTIEALQLVFMDTQNTNNNIELKNVSVYDKNKLLLSEINLELNQGELIGIIGKSGAGKTTILNTIISFDNIKTGKICFNNQIISTRKDKKKFRKNISYISQFPNLINDLSVLDNLNRLCEFKKSWFGRMFWNPKDKESEKIIKILESLGLKNKLFEKTEKLSGGEKQRLLVAIEIYNDKSIIFADEPTSNLDPFNADLIIKQFKKMSKNKIVVINIHDLHLAAKYCDKLICLEKGKIKNIIEKKSFGKGNLNEFFD